MDAAPPKSGGPLLDTLNEMAAPVGTATNTEVNGTTTMQNIWSKDLPSEEEQMKMLSEMDDDGWNTVQKGGKNKRKNATPASAQSSDLEGVKAGSNAPTGANGTANKKEGPTAISNASNKEDVNEAASSKIKTTKDKIDPKIWNHSNIHNHPDYDPEFPYALTGHPEDSDWAVV